MIPEIFIEQWRSQVAWKSLAMVEQDLIISRAIIDLYNNQIIRESLVFRGGTALNKLYINPPARYSEDIDLVQIKAGPIGETLSAIRSALSWLGEPKCKLTERSAKLIYRYTAVDNTPAKLKIEINTTEHFNIRPLMHVDFVLASEWFSGQSSILTYHIEELMATKLRALYQRRKGRDLFDLWLVLSNNLVDIDSVVQIFLAYLEHEGLKINQMLFTENMICKKNNSDFVLDMHMLLSIDTEWEFEKAFQFVKNILLTRLPVK